MAAETTSWIDACLFRFECESGSQGLWFVVVLRLECAVRLGAYARRVSVVPLNVERRRDEICWQDQDG